MAKVKKPSPSKYEPKQKVEQYPKFARPGSVMKKKVDPTLNNYSFREGSLDFKSVPSVTTSGGSTAKKAESKYTGDHLIGVSIVHKSCLTPVFSNDEAKDLASMRR